MIVTLIDLEEAEVRLKAGEPPYEFMTDHPQLRLLGPACQYGATLLQSYRQRGLYAESLAEAREMARAKNATVTGVWFVKREPVKVEIERAAEEQ